MKQPRDSSPSDAPLGLMDTPAARLERVLAGVMIPVLFLTALALAEGRIEILGCTGTACATASQRALTLPTIALLCLLGLVILRFSRDRSHGGAPLDRWFSREQESIMRERLEEERFESADEGLSSKWAELERDSLEKRFGEDE